MALNTTAYNTQTIFGRHLRFFNDSSDHTNAYCAWEDLITCLDLKDWGSRIPGAPGGLYAGLVGSEIAVLVSGVGWLNCIPTARATDIATYSPQIGRAQQDIRAAVLAAITAGAAALP